MSSDPTPLSGTKIYGTKQASAVWICLVAVFGIFILSASISQHSLLLTISLLLGTVVLGYIGYWALSNNYYFISETSVGFKDIFRSREVLFDEIQSVSKSSGRSSYDLVFICKKRTVRMPLDPLNNDWYFAVVKELSKRGVHSDEKFI